MEFETVIGLEIHTRLQTSTKLFCGCPSSFGAPPNTHACPVCLGHPGALPVLNRRAVELAVTAGLALGCRVAPVSVFARKNYFYPDLPKGYQISQYELPLCVGGGVTIDTQNGPRTVALTRIHLEEDAGKLIHDQGTDSLFDVNRCGTPLIEIVSEPDLYSPAQAWAFLTELKRILAYLGVSDCNMEEGSLRCDANISLRPAGSSTLGTKTELKNMNSFRGVEKALEYEVLRQRELLCAGERIVQQTFLWNADCARTEPMRTKEDAHDYRYFPDPDLAPLQVDEKDLRAAADRLPELPRPRRERLVAQYGLRPDAAEVLTESRVVADYFEAVVAHGGDAGSAANWVMSEILRYAKVRGVDVDALHTTAARLARLLSHIKSGTLSGSGAKKVLAQIEEHNEEVDAVIERLGLVQVSDTDALRGVIESILAANPAEVQRFRSGEEKLLSFFVGRAMRATRGKGNPVEMNRLLRELLSA